MNSGEICARLYSSGKSVRLRWSERVITALEPAPEAEGWLAPALVDLQVNGFAGVDFQRDDLSVEDLLRAVAGLRQAGCGRFLLTLMTDHWETMLKRLAHLRQLRAASPALRSAMAGWHLEGPFLSSEPGFCGAHNPDCMVDPSLEQIRQLRSLTEGDRVLMTLAPERAGALEVIALAASLGIRVSLGHTNASAETLQRALKAGASGFTHLGNACPQQLDRHDNILWRVLDTAGLLVSLIPDGIHVSPPLFRLAHRVLADTAIYYTADAVAPAGAPPGRYRVGSHTVEVGADQVVRQPGKSNFAGSALRPIDGVFRAARMLGQPWQSRWGAFSSRPAAWLGLRSTLAPGEPCYLCAFRLNSDGQPIDVQTIVAGQ